MPVHHEKSPSSSLLLSTSSSSISKQQQEGQPPPPPPLPPPPPRGQRPRRRERGHDISEGPIERKEHAPTTAPALLLVAEGEDQQQQHQQVGDDDDNDSRNSNNDGNPTNSALATINTTSTTMMALLGSCTTAANHHDSNSIRYRQEVGGDEVAEEEIPNPQQVGAGNNNNDTDENAVNLDYQHGKIMMTGGNSMMTMVSGHMLDKKAKDDDDDDDNVVLFDGHGGVDDSKKNVLQGQVADPSNPADATTANKKDTSSSTCLQVASDKVRDLLLQLTAKDAPPRNEEEDDDDIAWEQHTDHHNGGVSSEDPRKRNKPPRMHHPNYHNNSISSSSKNKPTIKQKSSKSSSSSILQQPPLRSPPDTSATTASPASLPLSSAPSWTSPTNTENDNEEDNPAMTTASGIVAGAVTSTTIPETRFPWDGFDHDDDDGNRDGKQRLRSDPTTTNAASTTVTNDNTNSMNNTNKDTALSGSHEALFDLLSSMTTTTADSRRAEDGTITTTDNSATLSHVNGTKEVLSSLSSSFLLGRLPSNADSHCSTTLETMNTMATNATTSTTTGGGRIVQRPPSLLSSASSLDPSDPTLEWQQVVKLGHAPMASMCSWTLAQHQNNSSNDGDNNTLTRKPQQLIPAPSSLKADAAENEAEAGVMERSSSSGLDVRVRTSIEPSCLAIETSLAASPHHPSVNTLEKEKEEGEEKKTDNSEYEGATAKPCEVYNCEPLMHQTKATAGSMAPPLTEGQQRQTPPLLPKRRQLHMFGSEYARHLSKCQLAPRASMSSLSAPSLPSTSRSSSLSSHLSSPRRTLNKIKRGWQSSRSQQNNNNNSARSAASSTSNGNSAVGGGGFCPILEEAPASIRTGALLDIVFTVGDDRPPRGYYRVSKTASGRPFFLSTSTSVMMSPTSTSASATGGGPTASPASSEHHHGSKGKSIVYLHVKKESCWDQAAQRPCVTALAIIFPDRQEFVPPGFCIARRFVPQQHQQQQASRRNADLNNNSISSRDSAGRSHARFHKGESTGIDDQQQEQPQEWDGTGPPADLNLGGSERVHLCFRRSREGNPITGMIPLRPDLDEPVPPGYTVVERTPRNHVATLLHVDNNAALSRLGNNNNGTACKGRGNNHNSSTTMTMKNSKRIPAIFLSYRQRLANLETLRPLPLLLSASGATTTYGGFGDVGSSGNRNINDMMVNTDSSLQAYYATGATIVCSNVGKYHILDRSTHSLLSPSSVANRLQLIEISRRRRRRGSLQGQEQQRQEQQHEDDADGEPQENPRLRALSADSSTRVVGRTRMRTSSVSSEAGKISTSHIAELSTTKSMDISSEVSLGCLDDSGVLPFPNVPVCREDVASNYDEIDEEDGVEASPLDEGSSMRRSLGESLKFIPTVAIASAVSDVEQAKHRLDARVNLLTPILTACYTRHGGAASVALDGLINLLKETDFFSDDVDLDQSIRDDSSSRFTLLDLGVQVVCDVATTGSEETTFGACVEFVESAVAVSQAQLNTRTVGYIVRFYLFVFYFGASTPTTKSNIWPNPSWRTTTGNVSAESPSSSWFSKTTNPDDKNQDQDDLTLLHDPRGECTRNRGYLPGGAPQSAALAFRHLITLTILRLGRVAVSDSNSPSNKHTEGNLREESVGQDPYLPLLDSIISSLIDDSVEHVERANYTQLALHQVHRSGGSELFWYDMVKSCGAGMFAKDGRLCDSGKEVFVVVFAVLANLVKVASGKLRLSSKSPGLLPKDIASKLLSLELLLHFLEYWSDEQEALGVESTGNNPESASIHSIDTLAFSIRRTVVPCLLWNTRPSLVDPQVFKRVLRIVSELWSSPMYRKHCKVELGILIDQFAIRILNMGPQLIPTRRIDLASDPTKQSLLLHQVEVLREVKKWFSNDPKDVIELYLNYDTIVATKASGPTQLLPLTQSNVFERLCGGLSNIAELCGELIGDQIRENQSIVQSQLDRTGGGSVSHNYDTVSQRGVTGSSAIRDSARLLRKTSLQAISQIVKSLAICAAAANGQEFVVTILSWSNRDSRFPFKGSNAPSVDNNGNSNNNDSGNDDERSSELATPTTLGSDDEVAQFWRRTMEEPDQETPNDLGSRAQQAHEIALEISRRKSLKKAIEYLIACSVLTQAPRDVANYLLMNRSLLDSVELGHYLGEGGIGSEVDYWNTIRFLFVRATSFIGMNVEEGLRHFLTTSGFRLPGEAQKIDRIMSTFSQCYFEDNAGDRQRCPFGSQDAVYLLVFAIIMLNTDLHRSTQPNSRKARKMTKSDFINNLRGTEHGEEITREYLSAVYDSIEANPIAMSYGTAKATDSKSSQHAFEDMLANVRSSDALLRGLAVHDLRFVTIEDFTSIVEYNGKSTLADLTQSCVAKTWHQWHGVINTCLEIAHLDPQGMQPSVEILLYALSLTICLDMPTERSAFLSQLGRLRAFEEHRQGSWVSAPDHNQRHDDWFLEFERSSCSGTSEAKLFALRRIHEWVVSLQSALMVDVQNKVGMTDAVAELKDGDFLLYDPARAFLRSGPLTKKSGRTGRLTEYRFYLFSDVLLYASRESDGRYRIHEELPIHLMKVIDWFPPSHRERSTMFEVHHPRKSFHVLCESLTERKSWVDDIRDAIAAELERKMKTEAARLAAYANIASS